ncbi:MAG: type IV secretion system DNA-binding domain-containing protein [Acidobacteria bacterium]|nr:type IV secretion system DNA-binding domain-containing protein [Acidobacteriota bacterium]
MPRGYEAHEAMVADVKMWVKMGVLALLVCLVIQVTLVALVARSAYREQFTFQVRPGLTKTLPFSVLWKYYLPSFVLFGRESRVTPHAEVRGFFPGKTTVPVSEYRQGLDRYLGRRIAAFEATFVSVFRWSFLVYLLAVAYVAFFLHRSRKLSGDRFLRGAAKVPFEALQDGMKKTVDADDGPGAFNLKICGLDFPRDSETKHVLIMGTTGTGKSVLMNQVVRQLVQRVKRHGTHEKMIIYDVKGEFLSKHFLDGAPETLRAFGVEPDLVFYPFDRRCLRWSFFNEIRSDADFDVYAKIVFTPPKEAVADPFWLNAAKDVFVAGLRFLHLSGKRANADIWDFFCQDLPDIAHQLQALPLHHRMALKHIDTQNKGPGASVISVLTEKISFFRYLSGLDGPFSFRDFITSSRGRNLFLLNIKNYASIFRPLMTFAFDVMIRETLSLPDTDRKENRRIWFCIDEIGSLDQISVLFDLLTVARSKGGCLLVANQDLGRIEDIYGRANRRTFYNNFNTNFILRLNDPDTADFLSQSIGEREVIKVMGSRQMSPRESGDRKSFTDQDKTEKLILPSEFINQPDFHCVVKVSGHGISEGVIPRSFYDPVAPHFLDRYADQSMELTGSQEEAKDPEQLTNQMLPTRQPEGSVPSQERVGEGGDLLF